MAAFGWKCIVCAFTTLYFAALITHYNSSHNDNQCSITCGIERCDKEFTKGNSLAKHIRTHHRKHVFCNTDCHEHGPHAYSGILDHDQSPDDNDDFLGDENEVSCVSNSATEDVYIDNDSDGLSSNTIGQDDKEFVELPLEMAEQFLLKIKEENSLTTSAYRKIASNTSKLLNTVVTHIKTRVHNSLNQANINADTVDIQEPFDDLDNFLQTFSRQCINGNKAETYGNMTMKKIVLGSTRRIVKNSRKKRIVTVEDAFYYIPLLETLQSQLKSTTLLDYILEGPVYSDDPNAMQDFCNGTLFKNHPLFSTDDQALKLILYYDDVNVCNPLSNKIHKIGAFYFQLVNVPIKYRSKLKSINLLALCTTQNIKQYGMDNILAPIVEELKKLDNELGFPFQVLDGTLRLRGGLLALVADTPASQELGGYKVGVGGAFRKCRHCMATFDFMQEHFVEEDFVSRTLVNHEQCIVKLEEAPSKYLKVYYSKKAGITRKSKIMEAPYFDVCKQLPQDLMHIFLEGVVGYELKYMLNYYISEGLISLDTLNENIQSFPYGYTDKKNKPAQILPRDLEYQSSTNLGQSASGMWLLSRILPFVLIEYVDVSSEHWHCFCSLLEIMAISFSQRISYGKLSYLKQLIRDHLEMFKTLYNANITPKQHYMVHIPSLTLMFGPLIRSWCMRFESKHGYFKQLSKNMKNFKNLPYSLTSRYIAKNYAESIDIGNQKQDPLNLLFDEECSLGRAKEITDPNKFNNIIGSICRYIEIPPAQRSANLYSCSGVTIQSKYFANGKGNCCVIGILPNGLPEFGRLQHIWYLENFGVFFALQVVETQAFDDKLQAYCIADCNLAQGFHITQPQDLLSFNIFHPYTVNGNEYLSVRENFVP